MAGKKKGGPMFARAHILVADDDASEREAMSLQLSHLGYSVVAVKGGSAAVEQIEASEFALVIADIRMPGVDGVEVLKTIKMVAPPTEVIVVTTYADMACAVECVRAGASDFVEKPIGLEDLASAVERALERRRLKMTTALFEGSQRIHCRDDGTPLAERIAQVAMEVLMADDVSLMLLDNYDALRIVCATGLPESVLTETKLPLGERIAGRVALDETPAVLRDSLADDSRFDGVQSHGRVRSAIVYPLAHDHAILGVLNLNRIHELRRFGDTDLETAGILALQAATALQNEKLMEEMIVSERLASLGILSAGAFHEIATPLVYVSANVEMATSIVRTAERSPEGGALLSLEATKDIDDMHTDVATGIQLMQDIVSDMRRLLRQEQTQNETFDVNAAVNAAMRISGGTLRRGLEVETELGDAAFVFGNQSAICQVILNLVVNAAQAIKDASHTNGWIGIRSRKDQDSVVIEVSDNGPGIPERLIARIMQPFFTTKPRETGTGLGLSISRDIVERHGGRIDVQSELGRGATFTVSLPRVRQTESPNRIDSHSPVLPFHG